MLEVLQYEFIRNAVFTALIASVACGIIGVYVVVNRIVFLSDGISHAAFGGIGLGYFLGLNPIYAAITFAVAVAVGVGATSKKLGAREDTVIGVIWALGMAVGIIFVKLTPGYVPDLFSYLFGNILTVPRSDLIVMLVLDLILVLTVALLFKELLAISFDREFAQTLRLPVNLIYYILLTLVALTVVMLIRVVGVILVMALLTIPAAVSEIFTKRLVHMMFGAAALSLLFTLLGLWLSYLTNLPSGATIVLLASAVYFSTLLYNRCAKRK
ncbi:MAG: metal ABC transporter permease [Thaumarchaeota archaeon]|nr:metal ABC transporter permease [Nitrososphaerota archaeon]